MKFSRRQFLLGATLAASGYALPALGSERKIFDGHCHIIDPSFPIIANQGYTPPDFTLEQYLAEVTPLGIRGGVIVSGSFQGFDQSYLRAALARLGKGWVGVTQVADNVTDDEIAALSALGVRGLRFNIFRGRLDSVDDLIALASRAHAVAGWHAEIYADAAALKPHIDKLAKLPQIAIDHLGMTEAGLPVIRDLVSAGAKVKATGFGRVQMDVPKALESIASVRQDALVFGTDLPSTRAPRPFAPGDIDLVEQTLGADLARRVFWDNAQALYRLS
jgi:predicted TIM-barrel fold metal-dependent hydrolase